MNAALDALLPLRDIVAQFDLRAKKSLGQNFLFDQNLTEKIARAAGSLSDVHVLEIGPGPGGLTRALLHTEAASITAIEFDPRAIHALQSLVQAAQARLTLINGDALALDLRTLVPTPRAIVANLPYNIATPLLIGWLKQLHEDAHTYQSLTIMVQREVADRITASPGSKDYGRLSIITQWLCHAARLFDVPREAFTPQPKVTSSIVRLVPRKLTAPQPNFESVEKTTAAAFNQRRKMIRQSLKAYLPQIETLGLDPTLRAENLRVEDYLALSFSTKQNLT